MFRVRIIKFVFFHKSLFKINDKNKNVNSAALTNVNIRMYIFSFCPWVVINPHPCIRCTNNSKGHADLYVCKDPYVPMLEELA
jgi:hypothetical protein